MGIFRKEISRKYTIAIEADTKEEAQKMFDEWKEDTDYEWDDMEYCGVTTETWVECFGNFDAYNRSPYVDDFYILNKSKAKAKKYDLYIHFKDDSYTCKVYHNASIDLVAEKLKEFDKEYYFVQEKIGDLTKEDSEVHNCEPLFFTAHRRV